MPISDYLVLSLGEALALCRPVFSSLPRPGPKEKKIQSTSTLTMLSRKINTNHGRNVRDEELLAAADDLADSYA